MLSTSGIERHMYAAEKAFPSARGGESTVVGINMDISEPKSREAQIQEINKRLETLIGQARIGILVHQDFTPIIANEELARIFGYESKDEILRMPSCAGLFADHEQERVTAYTQARLTGGNALGFYAVKGKKKDGSLIDLENHAFPIQWGDRLSVCAMLTDVTEQKKLESQLRQSQRLEAVGQLTGGVAHDFNNLLTVIVGNAELLTEHLAEDPNLYPLAEMTRTAGRRAATLTQRLLAFARRQALDPSPVDVNRLLLGMNVLLAHMLREDINLRFVQGADLWPALADAAQLENVILNLCINARDAMPSGGRLILETTNTVLDRDYAALHADVIPGQYVLISVSDTGCGIPPENLDRVFDPFFTTKEVGKGTGLGLSMVYGFVKQSNGHLKIYSELDQGTTVKIYLPRSDIESVEVVENFAAIEELRGSELILVAEDDDLVRRHARDQLTGLGYKVIAVKNGPEALAVLGENADIDLLFTDIVMPGGMNGRELADAAILARPALKVLYTSGYTENAVVHHGRLDRGVELLTKPYTRLELARKLRGILD